MEVTEEDSFAENTVQVMSPAPIFVQQPEQQIGIQLGQECVQVPGAAHARRLRRHRIRARRQRHLGGRGRAVIAFGIIYVVEACFAVEVGLPIGPYRHLLR